MIYSVQKSGSAADSMGSREPVTINDMSPLKLAKDTDDMDFVAHPVVQKHLKE